MLFHVVIIHTYFITMFQYDSEDDDDTVEVTKNEQVVCLSTVCSEDMYICNLYARSLCVVHTVYDITFMYVYFGLCIHTMTTIQCLQHKTLWELQNFMLTLFYVNSTYIMPVVNVGPDKSFTMDILRNFVLIRFNYTYVHMYIPSCIMVTISVSSSVITSLWFALQQIVTVVDLKKKQSKSKGTKGNVPSRSKELQLSHKCTLVRTDSVECDI